MLQKTLYKQKGGETHIHQRSWEKPRWYTVFFFGGVGIHQGCFFKVSNHSSSECGSGSWNFVGSRGFAISICSKVVCGKFCPTLQINSQKGELSIRKMEVQVENFDTQLSMSFKSRRATALKSNSSPLKNDY